MKMGKKNYLVPEKYSFSLEMIEKSGYPEIHKEIQYDGMAVFLIFSLDKKRWK